MEYVGTAYAGFQRQPGKVTVQTTLEAAIAAVTQEQVRVVGSGRTDAGAHAAEQVIAFSTRSALPLDVLRRAINVYLPADIVITSSAEVASDFHPRFDASSRVYRYLIWNRPERSPFWSGRAAHVKARLEESAMNLAAKHLIGAHDFGAFVPATGKSAVRTMFRADCRRDGHLVAIELEASGFMRQMVRSIAGTLIRVGLGKLSVEEFGAVLQSGDRARAATTAPSHGLYLVQVKYER